MQGELRFPNVPEWLPRADEIAASGRIDLGQVTRIDSAGAAFLLELKRRAHKSGRTLELVNPSEQARGLLEFLQVDGVLKLAK